MLCHVLYCTSVMSFYTGVNLLKMQWPNCAAFLFPLHLFFILMKTHFKAGDNRWLAQVSIKTCNMGIGSLGLPKVCLFLATANLLTHYNVAYKMLKYKIPHSSQSVGVDVISSCLCNHILYVLIHSVDCVLFSLSDWNGVNIWPSCNAERVRAWWLIHLWHHLLTSWLFGP